MFKNLEGPFIRPSIPVWKSHLRLRCVGKLPRYRLYLLSPDRAQSPGLTHVLTPHSHYGGHGGRSCVVQPLGRRSGRNFSRPWHVQWPTKVALQIGRQKWRWRPAVSHPRSWPGVGNLSPLVWTGTEFPCPSRYLTDWGCRVPNWPEKSKQCDSSLRAIADFIFHVYRR